MDKHNSLWDDPKQLRKKRIIAIVSVVAVVLAFLIIAVLLGKPIANALRNKEQFRETINNTGFWKYPLMVGVVALQVIIALIPGEPIEIIAGYIFGGWMGMFLCLIGLALGSLVIILAVKKYGMRLVTLFVQKEQLDNLRFFKDTRKRDVTTFLLFLIPGTPKDVLTYLVGLAPIKVWKYILITTIARIPSVITSTMGGKMLATSNFRLAIIIFAITLVITGIAYLIYKAYEKAHPHKEDDVEVIENAITDEVVSPVEEEQTPLPQAENAVNPDTVTADEIETPEKEELVDEDKVDKHVSAD